MVKLLLVIATMMSLVLLGCVTPDQDVENEPGLGQEQQQFQESIENQLNALDTRLEELSDQANQLAENAQAEFNQRMEQLEQQRTDIGDRLDQIPQVAEDEWQNFTAEIEESVNDLQQAADDLAQSFNF